ncbi:DsbA family protein [Janthinobacterium sp. SUN118]|uniref:DsbA family protein n=1 Tax=Janthinobacterium sp. SUN118 TaxID=3004100 RepID=UPI0025AF3683|nr:DsbA family protein [Janthinobacterium sp. SUN118]MDN2712874.1 DsbA family protein [Janthinobacterium sp. SUN118]
MPVLHYIFDPLCGWCYGAAPLVEAARAVPGLTVALHGGGMMTGSNRRQITPEWRGYVLPHDRRIEQLSGQPFGDAYLNGLLNDTTAMMDSAPPITAILAAQDLAGKGLDMLHRLQRAHYVEGLRIADLPVLVLLAQQLGLDGAAFDAAYARQAGAATEQHIAASRALLAQVGGQGFPTFVLDDGAGKLSVIDIGGFLGQPAKWQAQLGGACGAAGCAV